nr:Uncharacterised protein [Raoultella sp. NCTC 9187]
MSFRQGAMALVLAGLLGGWRGTSQNDRFSAGCRRLPGGQFHGADHAVLWPQPSGG